MTSQPPTAAPSPAVGQAGFTLLEILLALFVFAIVMTIISLTMGRSVALVRSTEQQAEIYAMARTTLLRIQEDVEAIFLLPPSKVSETPPLARRQFILTERTDDGHDNDTLQFLTMAVVPTSGSGPGPAQATLITYETAKVGDQTLSLWRNALPLNGAATQTSSPTGERAILCELLTGIDFHVADRSGNEHPAWDSDAHPDDALPQRVTVTLRFHDPAAPTGESRFQTSFLIPVAANR
jgi:prepilin-type N-terminal cleavage/methylation domain-containing protein